MRASRIMKLVAEVSSSMSSRRDPAYTASTMFAAWEVEPEALSLVNFWVSRPRGRRSMKGRISTALTRRPSSARTFTAVASAATRSRPSPGTWSYTPVWSAERSVLLPWKPPPTISVTPFGMRIPRTGPAWGRSTVAARASGARKGRPSGSGCSSTPLFRGRTDPSATKATASAPSSQSRRTR